MSALLPTALLAAAVLVTGCGGNSGSDHSAAPASSTATAPGNSAAAAGTSPAPAPAPSELAHMQKLVDEADSAAATADSDAAGDK